MGTAVSKNYQVPFSFTGKIDKLTVELKGAAPGDKDKAEIDKLQKEGTIKKALSD
jgi:arylsulfatase